MESFYLVHNCGKNRHNHRLLFLKTLYDFFDTGKRHLLKQGIKLASLEEIAELRILSGYNSEITEYGGLASGSVVFVPRKGFVMSRSNFDAKQIVKCHKSSVDYYLNKDEVEEALSDYILLKRQSIPTDKFSENSIALYAFGNYAENYGKFLYGAGIKEMHLFLPYSQRKPFARPIFLCGIGEKRGNAGIYAEGKILGIKQRIFGVKYVYG